MGVYPAGPPAGHIKAWAVERRILRHGGRAFSQAGASCPTGGFACQSRVSRRAFSARRVSSLRPGMAVLANVLGVLMLIPEALLLVIGFLIVMGNLL